MAGRRDIQAGRAYVTMYVRNKGLIRGLRNAQARMRAFGSGVQAIGMKMLRMGAVMAVPFAFATRTFMGFEDQMLTVKAVTGAVGDEFEKLTAKAKLLGRTTSFMAAEVAGGMIELGRGGFSPAEIDASIASVLNLARATGTELPRAAEIAAGTLRAFNLEADQMGRVGDVMVATANNSAQTLEQLGDSMTYAAPIAQEYGLTLEETSKALGVMAEGPELLSGCQKLVTAEWDGAEAEAADRSYAKLEEMEERSGVLIDLTGPRRFRVAEDCILWCIFGDVEPPDEILMKPVVAQLMKRKLKGAIVYVPPELKLYLGALKAAGYEMALEAETLSDLLAAKGGYVTPTAGFINDVAGGRAAFDELVGVFVKAGRELKAIPETMDATTVAAQGFGRPAEKKLTIKKSKEA